MIYVFVDFEMNMIDSEYKKEKKICKSEIIEIGAVKLDEDYNEIDSFKSYVKPAYGTMASRIIKLTGITDDMVEHMAIFRLAREEPASYVSVAMRPGGLQDYVDVWNELN